MKYIPLRTFTFFPSSFKTYSTVVRMPFSSTESDIFCTGASMRTLTTIEMAQLKRCTPSSSISSAQDVFILKILSQAVLLEMILAHTLTL